MANVATTQPGEGLHDMRQRQQQCRCEWRQLCEALEGAQGQDLVRNSVDKFQIVRTYRVYGRGFERLAAELRRAARHEQYDFFRERGVPMTVLTASLVDLLLDDWKAAIVAKKRRVSEIFRFKYGEDIESCIVTPEDSVQLGMSQALHDADALLTLSDRSQPGVDYHEYRQLRVEVERLQEQMAMLRSIVDAQMNQLRHLENKLRDCSAAAAAS